MNEVLYKVSAPRDDMTFLPGTFWHTPDWESSTTRRREGYLEDCVLYAGDFDEVTIHLLPRVRTVRVRVADADASALRALGLACSAGKAAHVFVEEAQRAEVVAFCPTVFHFASEGFTRVRRGEYVSWTSQVALSSETMSLAEALVRWNVEVCYVESLGDLIATLSAAGIYFDEQT
jgi:hypothetical protein